MTARLSPASKATQQGRIEKGIALVFQVSPPQAERELADGNAGDFLQAQARVEQAIVVDDIGLGPALGADELLVLPGVVDIGQDQASRSPGHIPGHIQGVAVPRRIDQSIVIGDLLAKDIDDPVDRKSTRLNSSHVAISYAVFCLKKKNMK